MVVLAAIAAVISYRHMYVLVQRYGETSWTAALLPVSVDGMIATASMALLADSRQGRRGGVLPWVLLVLGSTASLAANVMVAEPSLVGRLVAAWPSAALIGAYELLMRQIRHASKREASAASYVPHMAPVTNQVASHEASYEAAEAVNASYGSPTGLAGNGAASYETHTAWTDLSGGSYNTQTNGTEGLVCDADEADAGGFDGADQPRLRDSRPASGLQRRAWRWALAHRTPAGELPSGKAIAERFGRSERWGRLVKQAGLAEHLDGTAA